MTPTEETVADLVADGLSNRDIATRLFVSRRTVETHVSAIYRKLEVGSRVELVRLVLAHRNPWIDPLSHIQVALLRRSRDGDEDAHGPLLSTIGGIAAGMRNTG